MPKVCFWKLPVWYVKAVQYSGNEEQRCNSIRPHLQGGGENCAVALSLILMHYLMSEDI